jgi:signal transduction histidine kinase
VSEKPFIPFRKRSLRKQFLTIGILNAVLIFSSLLTLWFAIGQQSNDALLVNLAGRQRMLTQRIAKNCLILSKPSLNAIHDDAKIALDEALMLYEDTLLMFYEGGTTLLNNQITEANAVEGHNQALENLLVEWSQFKSDTQSFALSPDDVQLEALLMSSEGMLSDSDNIVSELQLDAEAHLRRVRVIALGIGFLEILLLGIFLFNMENAVLKPFKRLVSTLDRIGTGELLKFEKKEQFSEWEITQKHIVDMNQRLIQATSALNLMNEELENMVTLRTEALNQKIYELQKTYDKLIESEKQASLGSLVAGVAHEVNTPLGVCVTAASHLNEIDRSLIEKLETGRLSKTDLEEYLEISREISEIIFNNINRAAEIIQNFKKIAVDQSDDRFDHFYIDDYVNDVLFSLKHILKHRDCTIQNNIEHISVFSDPGAFGQIYTNFIMNTLQHGYGERDSIDIQLNGHFDPVERQLILSYQDRGKGIDPSNLKRIFEPFYTTNRKGGGSGLGLNVVYQIVVNKLQGDIQCFSEVEKYTKFEIVLPEKSIIGKRLQGGESLG